jgi:hypothetical protein
MRLFVRTGNRRVPVLLLLLGLACPGFLGCGRPVGSVTGVVKYQGKALPYGDVTFHSDDGLSTGAQIKEDGSYTVPRVIAGPVKITVVCVDPKYVEDGRAAAQKMREMQLTGKRPNFDPSKYIKVPLKYGDAGKSGLTYTVVAGPNTHDIDLK